MPNLKPNSLIAEISGMMGDAILTKHPDISNGEPSEAQIAQLEQFKQATKYARAAMAQPKVRAAYKEMAAKEHQGPFGLAFADYFKGINRLPRNKPGLYRNQNPQLTHYQPYGGRLDMKYHLVYASENERKVLEIDTDNIPPNVGDYVQLPFGENKEMCRYCAADIYSLISDKASNRLPVKILFLPSLDQLRSISLYSSITYPCFLTGMS